jgi:hypothetical protein
MMTDEDQQRTEPVILDLFYGAVEKRENLWLKARIAPKGRTAYAAEVWDGRQVEIDGKKWVVQYRETDFSINFFNSSVLKEVFDGESADDFGVRLAVMAWDLQLPGFENITMEEFGNQFLAQRRAAIRERHRRYCQRKKEKVGQKGTHNPRQKKAGIIGTYAASARGNNNRALAAAKERSEAAFGKRKQG